MTARIVPARSLDEAQRCAAADLARAALDAYYAPLPAPLARELIAAAFLADGDEVADAVVAIDADGQPLGLVAGYPLGDLAQRQQAALYHLLSNLPREEVPGFVAGARALAAQVPAIGGEGHYLARIGVAAAARGTGLAERLLAHFLMEAGGRDALLHVHGDNARAIAFYRKHGFVAEDIGSPYHVMRRAAA